MEAQLTLKKGAPGDQVFDLLCVQLREPTDVDDARAGLENCTRPLVFTSGS